MLLSTVALAAACLALATVIGPILPLSVGPRGTGSAACLAGGIMLAAGINLIYELQAIDGATMMLGLCIGALLGRIVHAQGTASRLIHALVEGLAVSVFFNLSRTHGTLASFALGIHNIAEGTMVPAGKYGGRTIHRLLLVALPQSLCSILVFMAIESAPSTLPFLAGLASGSMLFLVFSELLPSARADITDDSALAFNVVLSIAVFEMCHLALDWSTAHEELSREMFTALAWSLFAGLSTGLGGLFVTCIARESRSVVNCGLLGFAAGVMIALSVLDLIAPQLVTYGFSTSKFRY